MAQIIADMLKHLDTIVEQTGVLKHNINKLTIEPETVEIWREILNSSYEIGHASFAIKDFSGYGLIEMKQKIDDALKDEGGSNA